jgi:von Willebrand factor type A domain
MNCTRENLIAHPGTTSVRLIGRTPTTAVPEQAVHFIVLADRSGSMQSNDKMVNVKLSLDHLLEFMRPNDFLTVLPFDHETVMPPLIYAEGCNANNREMLKTRIGSLRAGGGTNIEAAIKAVPEILKADLPSRPEGIKTGVLLLTDGEATAGNIDSAALLALQRLNLELHPDLTLSTVGYGDDHNVALLTSLAINGSYNIVHTLTDVASVFGSILGGLRTAQAEATRLIVPASVRQRTTFKMSARGDGSQEILVGDIIAGGEQIVVLEGLGETDRLGLEYHAVAENAAVVLENVACSVSEDGQGVGEIAYLRCRTVDLMAEANRLMLAGSPPTAALLDQIAVLTATLQALPISPIITMLIGELERARRYVTMPPGPPEMMRTHSNQLSQHTTYLGRGGGGGGIMSTGSDDEGGDPVSPFATTYQRTISIGLTESVQRSNATNTVVHVATPYPMYLSPTTSLDPSANSSSSTMAFPPPPNNPSLHRS